MLIALHGGAGRIPSEEKEERAATLEEAADRGATRADPLKAVEAAVRILEENHLLNAGYGASLQLDGNPRLDAAIMRSDLSAGGVINVERIKHPISLANTVRKETPHVLLQGEGASELGRNYGLEPAEEMKTPKARERWEEINEKLAGLPYQEKLSRLGKLAEGSDTVGAVALADGVLAAATSTGGIRNQMKGRVGDSPIIGSGLYCNRQGAVSTTGIGEAIIKVNLAREAIYGLENGLQVQTAGERAISRLEDSTGSRAGLIALDNQGEVGAAYNTRDMQYVVKEG